LELSEGDASFVKRVVKKEQLKVLLFLERAYNTVDFLFLIRPAQAFCGQTHQSAGNYIDLLDRKKKH